MTIKQISERLFTLLEKKSFIEAQEEFFDTHVISLEPDFHPNPKTQGLQNLLLKEQQFLDNIESWENFQLSEPVVSKDHFSMRMFSLIHLKSGRLLEIDEIIVYEVTHGKITKEQFFYGQS